MKAILLLGKPYDVSDLQAIETDLNAHYTQYFGSNVSCTAMLSTKPKELTIHLPIYPTGVKYCNSNNIPQELVRLLVGDQNMPFIPGVGALPVPPNITFDHDTTLQIYKDAAHANGIKRVSNVTYNFMLNYGTDIVIR